MRLYKINTQQSTDIVNETNETTDNNQLTFMFILQQSTVYQPKYRGRRRQQKPKYRCLRRQW
jgi:hypothetical protein